MDGRRVDQDQNMLLGTIVTSYSRHVHRLPQVASGRLPDRRCSRKYPRMEIPKIRYARNGDVALP